MTSRPLQLTWDRGEPSLTGMLTRWVLNLIGIILLSLIVAQAAIHSQQKACTTVTKESSRG